MSNLFNTANVHEKAHFEKFWRIKLIYCNFVNAIHQLLLKVLIAPLNWGLGHATRCIPIIKELESLGHEVIIASDGAAMYLLQAEFPHLHPIRLPSYRIRYEGKNMVRTMAKQLPRMLYAIHAEKKAVQKIVREQGITHIISDNRYGCLSSNTHNILITHQLHLQIPGNTLQSITNWLLRKALNRFHEIWVPDMPNEPNLAGPLAHPPISDRVRYIGLLTRMRTGEVCEPDYDVAIVLSGPEPQRTLLEQRLIEQAVTLPYKFIIIQGRPKRKHHHFITDHIELVSFLTSEELNKVMLNSRAIVCRSGYSSIMDLAVLSKKALLIPTPGQTEQEYLARHLSEKGLFITQNQDELNLETALEQLPESTGFEAGAFSVEDFRDFLK